MEKLKASHHKAERQGNRQHRAEAHTVENIAGKKGAYLKAAGPHAGFDIVEAE